MPPTSGRPTKRGGGEDADGGQVHQRAWWITSYLRNVNIEFFAVSSDEGSHPEFRGAALSVHSVPKSSDEGPVVNHESDGVAVPPDFVGGVHDGGKPVEPPSTKRAPGVEAGVVPDSVRHVRVERLVFPVPP